MSDRDKLLGEERMTGVSQNLPGSRGMKNINEKSYTEEQ